MLGDILERLKGPEEVELQVEDVEKFFYERNERGIEQAKSELDSFSSELNRLIENLDKSLDDIREVGRDDVQTVEDVAMNIADKLEDSIRDFSDENFIQALEDSEQVLAVLDDLSMKEAKVLERISKKTEKFSDSLKNLKQEIETARNFKNGDYILYDDYRKIGTLIERYEELDEELKEVEERDIQGEAEDLEDKINGKQDELKELKNSDDMENLLSLKQRKNELDAEIEKIQSKIKSDLRGAERGLTKFLYEIQGFKGDISTVEELSEQRYREINDIEENIDLVEEYLEQNNLLDEREMNKFKDAADKIKQIPERKQKLKSLKNRKKDLEAEIDGKNVSNRIENKKRQIKDLEQELEEINEEVDRKKEKIKNIKGDKKEIESKLKNLVEEHTKTTVEIKP